MTTALGLIAFAGAFLLFGYRSVTYFITASAYSSERDTRGSAVGICFSGVISALVATAFLSVLFAPLAALRWIAVGIVAGILVEETNTAIWRKRLGRSTASQREGIDRQPGSPHSKERRADIE